jgi:hypothetical protein
MPSSCGQFRRGARSCSAVGKLATSREWERGHDAGNLYTHCDIPLFRLGRSGLDPWVEHHNTGFFEVTGVTRDDRQVVMPRRRGDDEVWLRECVTDLLLD